MKGTLTLLEVSTCSHDSNLIQAWLCAFIVRRAFISCLLLDSMKTIRLYPLILFSSKNIFSRSLRAEHTDRQIAVLVAVETLISLNDYHLSPYCVNPQFDPALSTAPGKD